VEPSDTDQRILATRMSDWPNSDMACRKHKQVGLAGSVFESMAGERLY
jgi:hypothetical protein